jgi:predicted RecB family nuclease
MDSGSGQFPAARQWVDKIDLTAYLRCPYAWWHLEQGLLSSEEAIGPAGDGLPEHASWEGRVEVFDPPPAPKELRRFFSEDVRLFGIPTLENVAQKIYGAPQGVDADSGALWPIKVGSHRNVRRADRLELAFDWMLLEPHRFYGVDEPTGWLVLERDGRSVPVEVDLSVSDFEQCEALLDEIRRAKRTGVKPRICGCPTCRDPLRDRMRRKRRNRKALTLLFGMGRGRAVAFEKVGVFSLEDLEARDPQTLTDELRDVGVSASPDRLAELRFHAQSYREGRAILFNPPPTLGGSFIALDLEYDAFAPLIWLIGLYLIDDDRCEHVALWADDAAAEQANLERLGELLDARPGQPVVTWAGASADLPQLRNACKRFGLSDLLDGLEERHVDLYASARHGLRLPIPELALGDVSAFFGVVKSSSINDGREAQMLFTRYLSRYSHRMRRRIRNELIAYNLDDLEALVETLWAIQDLPIEQARLDLARL